MYARRMDLLEPLGTPAAEESEGRATGRGGFDSFLHGEAGELAADVCDWLATLTVTEGRHAGEPLTVLPWQTEFIRGMLGDAVTEAGLSVARGNGKTTIFAALAAAALDGPLMRPRGMTVVVASSFEQAKILFDHTRHFLRPTIEARPHSWRVVDNFATAMIENRLTGARLKCIGSDAKRAHGLAPSLLLADEPAKWTQGGVAMLTALETSLGKQEGSRMVSLGTMPESPLHWFAKRMRTDAAGRHRRLYRASDPDDWRNPAQWAEANPSLEFMPDLRRQIAKECAAAESDPTTLAAFRALRLNLGTPETDATDELITAEQWRDCLRGETPPMEGAPVWGVDLGGTGAMSAVCAAWPNGRLDALAMFGGQPSLAERGSLDGVGDLYERCAEAGDLLIAAGRVPDVAELFEAAYQRFGGMPSRIIADRWRVAELQQALEGASRRWDAVPLMTRGQGYKDGSQDVRDFRKAVATAELRPVKPCLLLTAALAEAVVVTDASGNSKLAKKSEGGRRSRARDDAAAAAILAGAHRERAGQPAPAGFAGVA